MRILPVFRGLLGVWLLVSLAVSFCYAVEKEVEVVGFGECADCKQSNVKPSQAFSGLRVKIECKTKNGKFKTRGIGALNEQGKFLVSMPKELVKEECYAKLHSADSKPCPSPNGVIEGSKIVLKAKKVSKHKYVLPGKLKFSPGTCTSASFWPPYYSHPWFQQPFPSWSPYHNWLNPLPPPTPLYIPPQTPVGGGPVPPETPVGEGPVPPETPVVEEPVPQTPVYKEPPQTPVQEEPPQTPVQEEPPQTPVQEEPPQTPVYKEPQTPVYEQPPQTPVYEQPPQTPVNEQPPQTPVYEQPPQTPVYKEPQTPVYEQPPQTPVYKQPPQTPVYKEPPQTPVYKEPPQTPVYKEPQTPVNGEPVPPQTPVYGEPVTPQTPIYFHHPNLPPLPPYGHSHP